VKTWFQAFAFECNLYRYTQAALKATRAELEATKAELESTKAELETTKEELETTRNELSATKAELESARERIYALEAEVAHLTGRAALAPGGCQSGYMKHTGCHQLVFGLQGCHSRVSDCLRGTCWVS
jgi:phage-related minor tail protein